MVNTINDSPHVRNGVLNPWGGEVFVLPTTISQQGFWYLDQLEPGNPAYNIAVRFRLQGALRYGELGRALNEIVRRHESLRTVFESDGGQPVQVVAPSLSIRVPVVDLRDVPAEDRHERSEALTVEEARGRFDLSAGPLIRASLLRLDEQVHVLLVTVHHIVADGWSIGLITQELGALYSAYCEGLDSPLTDLPLQYGDFAVWQEQWLNNVSLRDGLSYWTRRLADLPPLEIPTDRPRPAVQTSNGHIESVVLPRDLTEALESLSHRIGITFFMFSLAALKILVQRHSGQSDVYVGTLVASRPRVDLEPLIGVFINPLVLRTDLSGDPPFPELLARVRETVLEALVNQDVPFERVVEAVQTKRDQSRHPVFQINFIYQRDFVRPLQTSGLSLTAIPSRSPGAIYDLNFFMVERADGWRASCEYNTDLYRPDTIRRMLDQFRTLLSGIAADPDRRISRLPLMTAEERRQSLGGWLDTESSLPLRACVHELFEAQVERTPDAVAVESEGHLVTYRELNALADRLASRLVRLGVGPEVLAGICVDRGPEMVVGLLGILKAGGAYLPLDPEYPRDRLTFMIEDAGLTLIVTQRHLASRIPGHGVRLVWMVDDPAAIDQQHEPVSNGRARLENLAYVIYTSGSTGKPKGVQIEHRSLTNYLSWAARAYDVAAGRGAPVHSSISFDLTITALFTPLIAGRRVHLIGEDRGVEGLGDVLRRESGFSLVKITPAHLQLLNQQLASSEAAGRTRAFVIGGEQLTGEQIAFWQEHAPDTLLVNEYGPTETVVGCCVYRVAPGERFPGGAVPIGLPIANTRLYLLDRDLEPVPVGVAGELYVGGVGVARGYLNRPQLTAEKFIPDPFGNEPGARLFRTGDLCRRRPDGNLEFLGRIDQQIKIRGYRIEPREVEFALVQHPAVREAVAVARDDPMGGTRLIAYVLPEGKRAPDPRDLRGWLKDRLPEYMVPSVIATLDAFPLNTNGKVDRQRLPEPADPKFAEVGNFVAPRNRMEGRLIELWGQVLGVKDVNVTDDFFDLGGHSLLAIKLLARIEQSFGWKISLGAFLQEPTIQAIAARLSEERPSTRREQVVAIQPAGSKTPLFLVDAGPFFRPLAHGLGLDQPVLGILLPELSGLPARFTVEDIAANLIEALREVQPHGPYYLGGWSHAGVIAYEVARQLLAQFETVALLTLFDSCTPQYRRNFKGLKGFPARLYLMGAKLRYHLGNLCSMRRFEALEYARQRLGTIHGEWKRKYWRIWYRELNRKTPDNLVANSDFIYLSVDDYRPTPCEAPVVLFRSHVLRTGRFRDPLQGWGELARGSLQVHEMPGEHDGMLIDPGVQQLARALAEYLPKTASSQDL